MRVVVRSRTRRVREALFVLLTLASAACNEALREDAGAARTTARATDAASPATLHSLLAPPPGVPVAQQSSDFDRIRASMTDVTRTPPDIDPAIWHAVVPSDNAMTPERVALGRRLYFDPGLSVDGSVACASCHDVTLGFTDQQPVSDGVRGQLGQRNAPTVLNAALLETFFLDGRAPSLEAQAVLPIVNPIEMGQPNGAAAAATIANDPSYVEAFQRAYGRAPNYEDIGRALAAFERTLIFLDAPFDRFLRGDASAISADARAGWDLFNGKARCNSCHQVNPSNPLFTDNLFHNIGIAARHSDFVELARRALDALSRDTSREALDRLAVNTSMSELGRFMITRNQADVGAFRTSQLRNIGITGPYMHDGSLATLWDVMDHYNKGGEANPFLDGGIQPLALTESEIDQLVAFMFSLTSDRFGDQNRAQFDRQRVIARVRRPIRDNDLASGVRLPFEPGTSATRPGAVNLQGVHR